MKMRNVNFALISSLSIVVVYPLAWLLASIGIFGEVGFGYYGEFNIAKRAILNSGCIESIQCGLHKDITLEDYRFTILTKSGWNIRLWFTENMNAHQVCEKPKGILVYNPPKGWQAYTVDDLAERLKEKSIKPRNIGSILCSLDELVPIFKANYYNENIPSVSSLKDDYLQYVVFETVPWHVSAVPVSKLKPVELSTGSKISKDGSLLRSFEFDVVTLDSNAHLVERHKGRAGFYLEDLGNRVMLEMVQVPGGTFLMGIPNTEAEEVLTQHANDDRRHYIETSLKEEMPQHSVAVNTFYIGMFEVTQAQWRAVAQLPKVKRELKNEPSFFKGDDLPVENVSWEDAMEFCDRLTHATGREYRLPSEAEWEYACRAGTTTPFHFGGTITADLASYCGYYPYGKAPWGIYREQTLPVGGLGTANAFGLYDMHGNVWEWCLDSWHSNYEGAPKNGAAWVEDGDDRYHPVRGGAWCHSALACTSTSRLMASGGHNHFGFRVVAAKRSQ